MLWKNRENMENLLHHFSHLVFAQQTPKHGTLCPKSYQNIIIIVIHTLPIVFIPPIMLFLALTAFIRRIFASIELRLGAFEATIFPDPG